MNAEMGQAADAILQAARESASLDELSDVDIDGDGSSSLSDIEDKDPEQDDDGEVSDDLSNMSDEENDSEAETERLEESPSKFRQQKDLVLNSHNDNQTYEPSPSKLQHQLLVDDPEEDEDEDPMSEDEISNLSHDSPKSSDHDNTERDPGTAPTSLEDSAGESKPALLSASDVDTRKRKRSIMAGGALDEELDEPLRKRTGSIMTPGDDYAIEDDNNQDEEGDASNHIGGNISGDEDGVHDGEEVLEEVDEPVLPENDETEQADTPTSPKRRGRKKKKVAENGILHIHEDDAEESTLLNGARESRNGDETADQEGDDEAEAAHRNEEELEKKRIALDQLSAIERQFTTFKERLYDERLEQLNRDEGMLRQSKPTHPDYLAMIQCVDSRRDERIRVADRLREYELETLKIFAVSKRSQILVQYRQEAREIREKQLESLGKHWYEIQHDRRTYAGNVPEYSLKFPKRRSQQIHNQVAYSKEVSILSGIAKYVGFPAAPPIAAATPAELEEDFEKMGRSKQVQQAPAATLPLQELAALRTAGSTSRFKPAEEQFIEQTPWANPQHPSHAHLIQRQSSAQQIPRTSSPFSQVQAQPRRHSHQHNVGGPISGTFSISSSTLHNSNGTSGGRISPHNPFTNASLSHTIVPSPLGSRQPSLSPQQNRIPPSLPNQHHLSKKPQDLAKNNGKSRTSEGSRDFQHEGRREPASVAMGQF